MVQLRINKPEEEPFELSNEDISEIVKGHDAIPVVACDNTMPTITNKFGEELSVIEYEFCLQFIKERDIAQSVKLISDEYSKLKYYQLQRIGKSILEKPAVQVYLKELQEELKEKYKLQAENIMDELADVQRRAKEQQLLELERKCIIDKAKVGGLLINKHETTHFDKLEVRFNDDFDPRTYIPEVEDADFEDLDSQ